MPQPDESIGISTISQDEQYKDDFSIATDEILRKDEIDTGYIDHIFDKVVEYTFRRDEERIDKIYTQDPLYLFETMLERLVWMDSVDISPYENPTFKYTQSRLTELVKARPAWRPLFFQFQTRIEEQIAYRKWIEQVFSSGQHLLAHGAYVNEIESICETGGMASSMCRLRKGLIKNATEMHRWRGNMHADTNAIFFYQWQEPGEYSIPGAYAATKGDSRGATDLSILGPASIAAYARCTVIKNSGMVMKNSDTRRPEIALTNSNETERRGELAWDETDDLVIPFDKLYYVTGKNQETHLRKVFEQYGKDNDWFEEHVLILDSDVNNSPAGSMNGRIRDNFNTIDNWIRERKFSSPELKITRTPLENEKGRLAGFNDVFQVTGEIS